MLQAIDVFLFSTQDCPERERVELWREAFGRAVMRAEIDPVAAAPFSAAMRLRQLPGLGIAAGFCAGMDFRRTSQLADNDDFILNAVTRGESEIHQGGKSIVLRAGEATLIDAAQASTCLVRGPTHSMAVRIPRSALAPLLKDASARLMQPLQRQAEALGLLVGYGSLFLDNARFGGRATASLAARHLLDLAASALSGEEPARAAPRGRGVRAARYAALEADIARNYHQSHLTIGLLASRHRLSVRYAQALLAEHQTSFSELLMARRLEAAHRLLSAPSATGRVIADTAHEVGFSDLSYFHRAFRRRFGASPGEVRAGQGSLSAGPST